jgi:pimeloyl-ACP methyl ester carboxylesterase
MKTEEVAFVQDDGFRLDGTVYRREDSAPAMLIVFCQGYNATREYVAPQIADGLAERLDAAVLTFDYSGFGTSEGPRNRLDPQRQVRDVRSGVSWMIGEFPSAASSVGLYGTSFGGAISTVAAAVDDRVRALVSVSPFASGSTWMRDLRPYWQWVEFMEEIEADRLGRVRPGARSKLVDPDWIMPRDPEAAAYNNMLKQQFPGRHSELDVVSAELISQFEPRDYAAALRGKPTLYVHCTRDLLIAVAHAEELARRAEAPLMTLDRIGHHDVYEGQPLTDILDRAAEWYSTHLTV